MAEPIPFLGANKELSPDPHSSDYSLPVFAKGNEWVSCWQLDKEEIKKVLETGRLWVIVKGRTHPLLSIATDEPFE